MKKQLAAVMTVLISASAVFALPVINPQADAQLAGKVTAILDGAKQQQEAAQKQEFVKVLQGTVVYGSFYATDLKSATYAQKDFKVEFYVKSDYPNTQYGNIYYTVYAAAGSKAEAKTLKKYVYGVSRDPHAPIDVILSLTLNGQQHSVTVLTSDPISLGDFTDYDCPRQDMPVKGTVGPCPKCGAQDPYHCGKGHIGPCSEDVAEVKKTATQEVVWERQHDKDCNDEYHCSCQGAIVKEIKGIAAYGQTELRTKSFDGGTFTAKLWVTKNNEVAYSVIPANGEELQVSVQTAEKTRRDPHESIDINLVVKEKSGKVTKILILSADATTL